jgi:adenosylhomocysteine nucleosidase
MGEIDKLSPDILQKSLIVFALESEAAGEFDGYSCLFTGIGKVNAAVSLTESLSVDRPEMIVNLGSAGSATFKRGEVVCCTSFIQRDMDVRGLGFDLYETPLSGIGVPLRYGLKIAGIGDAVCGTGDSFEMNHQSKDYQVVDMEAYPLALIARRNNIPFLCLKYISDGADGTAADDWNIHVHKAAEALKKVLF